MAEPAIRKPTYCVGRCLSPMAAELKYAAQEFLYVEQPTIDDQHLEMLLDQWQLERPNLILSVDMAIQPHPAAIINKAALAKASLQPWIEEASRVLVMGGEDPAGENIDKDKLCTILGKRLFDQMVETMIALLTACEQTNSWIYVESPDGSWILLNESLKRCSARPVILAIDKLKHEESPSWSGYTKEFGETLCKQTFDLAALRGNEEPPPLIPFNSDLWSDAWDGPFSESIFQSTIAKSPCSCATHFIFTTSMGPFRLSNLGPVGGFSIGGGGGCINSLRRRASQCLPNVIMFNTGKAADIYGAALLAIFEDQHTTVDGVVGRMKELVPFDFMEANEFWKAKGKTHMGLLGIEHSGEDWVLDMPQLFQHVSALLAIHKANPRLFSSTQVVLDALTATPAEVLNKLSQCFVSVSGGQTKLEVGAADAKMDSIGLAKRYVKQLDDNGKAFKRRANLMTICGSLLSVATTMISVASLAVDESDNEAWAKNLKRSPGWDYVTPLMIFLPALGGLILTVLSRFRLLSKWGSMYMAMIEMESEIWKFQANSGEYDETAIAEQNALDANKKKMRKNAASKANIGKGEKRQRSNAQQTFTANISRLYGHLLQGGMQGDALEPAESTYKLLVDDEQAGTAPSKSLKPTPGCLQRFCPWLCGAESTASTDDLVTDVSGESYYENRLQPELERITRSAPQLMRRLWAYEISIMILTLMTTLLATMNLKIWIPVSVAISGMLSAFLHYEALQGRITAINSAIAELTAFTVEWSGMGVLQRRGRLVKNRMVDVTEGAVIRVATSYSGGSSNQSRVTMEVGNADQNAQEKGKEIGKKD